MNLFPGHIVYDSENTYEILSFKNRENANVRNLETGEKKTILVKDIVEKYTLLNPVGYIGFNIVDLKANLQDVIVSLFKPEDLEETPAIPYAICRQCIVDFIYQQIDPKSEMLGISVSKDTCPANVDFSYMLSCDKVHSGTMIAVYLDYSLDKILSFIKTKDFDNTLYATMMDYAKHQSDKFGNFMYINITNQDCYNGYCKSLKILLETNNFMHDFYRAFNIYNLDFDFTDRDNTALTNEEAEVVSTLLCKNINSSVIVKYGYDIDLTNLSNSVILVADKNAKLYAIAYTEDRTKPYVVNIESLGEENVVKMNNIMTKAGKHDNNIKQAYDHIVFNKSKYI